MAENNSFLTGVGDIFNSVLTNAGGIAQVISATKAKEGSDTPGAATDLKPDAYGRLPGQAGYGTATPPAGISTASTWSTLSGGVKAAIIGGGALLVFLLGAAFFKRK